MSAEKKTYHRVSVTKQDGQSVKYDARVDVEADPVTGLVTYRVYSKALEGRSSTFHSSGNAASDAIHLERVCQQVYEFDQGYRARPVPKPVPAPQVGACGVCGGYGWIEDDTGYPIVCDCRE